MSHASKKISHWDLEDLYERQREDEIEDELNEISNNLEELAIRISHLENQEIRNTLETHWNELKDKTFTLRDMVESIREGGEEAWQDLKEAFHSGREEVRHGYREIKERLGY